MHTLNKKKEFSIIKWNCEKRGMYEIEIALSKFLKNNYEKLSIEIKKKFKKLTLQNDIKIYNWIFKKIKPKNKVDLIKIIILKIKNN